MLVGGIPLFLGGGAVSYVGWAIFGYGAIAGGESSITSKVNDTGVVAGDTTGVGTARSNLAAAGFGGDKAIFGYGRIGNPGQSMTNKVSNKGVVATDTTGVGTARFTLAAAGYGTDKAIFGYGYDVDISAADTAITNKVSNTGVVATDTTGVGTARRGLAAAGYGGDKAIFGFGLGAFISGTYTNITNKVSNTGVVANDTAGVGTARNDSAAAGYGGDKALFGYGFNNGNLSITNKVSNTGVVANNTTGVGTARHSLAAAGYGGDKAIFGYGSPDTVTNLVSNTGVVATDTTGVGVFRYKLAAASFGG